MKQPGFKCKGAPRTSVLGPQSRIVVPLLMPIAREEEQSMNRLASFSTKVSCVPYLQNVVQMDQSRLQNTQLRYTNMQQSNQILGGFLFAGQGLHQGQYISSKNNEFHLVMQADGNLVIYKGNNWIAQHAVWASNTWNQNAHQIAPFRFVLQEDGNAVLYDKNNHPHWSTNTYATHPDRPYRLELSDAGALVLVKPSQLQPLQYMQPQVYPPQGYPPQGYPPQGYPPHHYGPPQPQFAPGLVRLNIHTLNAGQTVNQDSFISSPNGQYHAIPQADGNFVIYHGPNFVAEHAKWSSNTWHKGTGPYRLVMQDDGNFVLYDSQNQPTWASDTWCQGPMKANRVVLGDDGKLNLYNALNQQVKTIG